MSGLVGNPKDRFSRVTAHMSSSFDYRDTVKWSVLLPGRTRMPCVTYSPVGLTDMSLDGTLTFQQQKIKTKTKNEDLGCGT